MNGGSDARALWLIIAAALILRALFCLHTFAAHPQGLTNPDSGSYQAAAHAFLQTGRFADSPEEPDQPMLARTPGYPALLAALYALGGGERLGAPLAQSLMSLALLALVMLAARALWGERAACAAGLLQAFDLLGVAYSQFVLSETAFTLLLAGAALLAVLAARQRQWSAGQALGLGALLALATLTRPVTYYLIWPVLLICLFQARAFQGSWRKAVLTALLVFLPWLLLVGGWQARNYATAGTARFSSIQEINLLFYRAAQIEALRQGVSLGAAQENLARQAQAGMEKGSAGRLDAYGRLGREIILSHPWLFIRVTAEGMARTLLGPGVEAFRQWGGGAWFWLAALVLSCLQLLALYLGTASWLLAWRREPAWAPHLVVWLILFYLLIVSAGPESYSRFRVPLMPLLAIYGGRGWQLLWSRLSGSRRLLAADY
ncbi:hypothetical protein AAU61_00945 [Desulfocarbo indianensis]|nr:hypothetical protein AAU61_00945 [Desulfocarbo indianensis]